jgi:hypothetical protein
MRTRLISTSLALAFLIAFIPFVIALADAPVTLNLHEEGTDVLVECGSFEVLDVYSNDGVASLFYDKEGNLVKIIIEYAGTDTFTNSVTGKAYPMDFHNTSLIDFSASPRRNAVMGVIFRLTVPGAGSVFLDVGRIVFERGTGIIFQAGPHQLFDGDFDALCAALE